MVLSGPLTVRFADSDKAMQCAFPIDLSPTGTRVACGRCMPCRINKRAAWTGRLLLEMQAHEFSSFATLTYDDDHVPIGLTPDGNRVGVLYPEHVRLLIKRLRKRRGLRYFACGEYGSVTQRPHYHLILFGIDPVAGEQLLRETWTKGFISVSEANRERAAYCAHYTVKKMTAHEDVRLDGREPEFMRASRKPGVGVPFVARIAEKLWSRGGAQVIADTGDVPRIFRLERKLYPLDQTMLKHLRRAMGIPQLARDRVPDTRPPHVVDDSEVANAVLRHDKMYAQLKSHGTL